MSPSQIQQEIAQIEIEIERNWALMGKAQFNIQLLTGRKEALLSTCDSGGPK